jgi:hypothetical protein
MDRNLRFRENYAAPVPKQLTLETFATLHRIATFLGQKSNCTVLTPVCVEFQFRRQLGSEISLCNVAARNMTQVLPLAVGARRSVEPA